MPETVTINTDFLLFDLDGTLVNSNEAVEATWHDVIKAHNENQKELPPLDPVTFLKSSHGSRTSEIFKRYFPYFASSTEDVNDFEQGIVTNYGHFAKPVNGSTELLEQINRNHHEQWAIVTSGTFKLAHGWVEKVFPSVNKPTVFITANDVNDGKPNPEGYLKAFHTLVKSNNGTPEEKQAIVFEDAPTGIKAGVNGKFVVVGIATTFSKQVLLDAGATYVIEDLSQVRLINDNKGSIEISLNVL